MHNLFDITNLIGTYGYLGIFIVVFLESGIFFALPGDSLLFTAGILASAGLLNVVFLIPMIFISTLLGGIFGYWIGEHIERFRRYSFLKKILRQDHIDKAHKFFDQHGKTAIVFSRFVPIVRTFAPIVAGVAKMNFKLFLRYSVISSVLWSVIVTLVGFFLGQSFPWIKDYMPLVIAIVVILSVLPALFEMFRKRS